MPQGDEPRAEPEIILPDHVGRRAEGSTVRPRVFVDARGSERVYVARIGPLGLVLAMLLTGIVFVVMFALLLGAMLIWLPLLIALVVGAMIAGFLRAYFRRSP